MDGPILVTGDDLDAGAGQDVVGIRAGASRAGGRLAPGHSAGRAMFASHLAERYGSAA